MNRTRIFFFEFDFKFEFKKFYCKLRNKFRKGNVNCRWQCILSMFESVAKLPLSMFESVAKLSLSMFKSVAKLPCDDVTLIKFN